MIRWSLQSLQSISVSVPCLLLQSLVEMAIKIEGQPFHFCWIDGKKYRWDQQEVQVRTGRLHMMMCEHP